MKRFIFVGAICALIGGAIVAWADGLSVPFNFPSTTCTNQFIRSLAVATGVGTCAIVGNADLATMSASTIKGQTVGGSGAPVDLTAAQAATVIGSVGGALKSCQFGGSRDLTTATGSVSYTGCGFAPTSCLATGEVGGSLTSYVTIIGFAPSTFSSSTAVSLGASLISVDGGVLFNFKDVTGSNIQTGAISSYDADGLTISWTKTASPTGTAIFRFMCFR